MSVMVKYFANLNVRQSQLTTKTRSNQHTWLLHYFVIYRAASFNAVCACSVPMANLSNSVLHSVEC